MRTFAIEVNKCSIEKFGVNTLVNKISSKNNKFSNYTLKNFNDRNSLRISFPGISFAEGLLFSSELQDISNKFQLDLKRVIVL